MVSPELRARYDEILATAATLVDLGFDPDRETALRRISRARLQGSPPAERREDWRRRQSRRAADGRREARRIPLGVRRAVLAAGVCVYCEDDATDVDHILPVSRGGTRRRSNLAPACRRCNFEKLDFTPDEWRVWRASMGLTWPPVPVFIDVLRRYGEAVASHPLSST